MPNNRSISRRQLLSLGLLASAGSMLSLPAFSSESPSDRRSRLLAKAASEGPLLIYHIIPTVEIEVFLDLYRAEYGLEVTTWKGSNEGILQRVFAETRAGRQEFDMLQLSSSMQPVYDAGALSDIGSVIGRSIQESNFTEHGQWLSTHSAGFVFAYNTNLVAPQDLPSKMEDLADAKWAGQLAFSQGADAAWIATLYEALGDERATAFLSQVAGNGFQIRRGYNLIGTLLAAGEFSATTHMFAHTAAKLKAQGAPIDYFPISPSIAIRQYWSIAKMTKRSASASLFFDLLMSKGEAVFSKSHYLPSSAITFPEYDEVPLTYVDPLVERIENARDWRRRYSNFLKSNSL